MVPDETNSSNGPGTPEAVPAGSPLAARWASLHGDDQEFALMALDVLTTGEVDSFDAWVRFVDVALDLQPAVDERIIDHQLVRRIALAITRESSATDEPTTAEA